MTENYNNNNNNNKNVTNLNQIAFAFQNEKLKRQQNKKKKESPSSPDVMPNNFMFEILNAANKTNEDDVAATNDDEWTHVPVIEAKFASENKNNDDATIERAIENKKEQPMPLLHFKSAWQELIKPTINELSIVTVNDQIEINVLESRSTTEANNKYGCFEFLYKIVFGQPILNEKLYTAHRLIYHLAHLPFNNDNPCHFNILQTIYKKLTKSTADCPRYGPHWEQIGFQGNDPATDLRGCGMLSLILILQILDVEYCDLTTGIYNLSKHETQHFPFCLVAINLVSVLFKLLNQNVLNRLFNKMPPLIKHHNRNRDDSPENLIVEYAAICGRFFMALYLEFFITWKSSGKTIRDFGFVLNDIELKATNSTKVLYKQVDIYLYKAKIHKKLTSTSDLATPAANNNNNSNQLKFSKKSKKDKESNDNDIKFTKFTAMDSN